MLSTGNPALRIINRSWSCIWITYLVALLFEGIILALAPSSTATATFWYYLIGATVNLVLFFLCVRALRVGSDQGLTWYKVLLWLGVLNGLFVTVSSIVAGTPSRAIGAAAVAIPIYVLPLIWLGDKNFVGGFNALRNPDWYTEPVNTAPPQKQMPANTTPPQVSAQEFCANCGTKLSGRFCGLCGSKSTTT